MTLTDQDRIYIKSQAETNTPLQNATSAQQQAYEKYQQEYIGKITQKALAGQQLDSPNDWKNQIYNQVLGSQNQSMQPSQPNQNSSKVSIDDYIRQSQANSDAKMQSLQAWLQNSANSQLDSQKAQLGFARDQALAQIEMALQEAINKGEISVREAEKQYEEAKKGIHNQAYLDSEMTNLAMHDRGIQNSAQSIGLMQGDNARRNSLLNDVLTTRDEQINSINNQLSQMQYQSGMNKVLANSQYEYGLAQAQGDIFSKMYEQMAGMSFQEYQRLANNEFALQQGQINHGYDLDKLGLQQQYQLEQMSQDQKYKLEQMAKSYGYDLDKMSVQQKYQLAQMAQNQQYTQDNMALDNQFSLNKLSVQQRYQLEQMAQSFGYDVSKMTTQQQYQLAQMAQSFGYDMSLQASSQQHDKYMAEQKYNLDHSMLQEKMLMDEQTYEKELERQLRYYTEGTAEYSLNQFQQDSAKHQAMIENTLNLTNAINNQKLATLLESYPPIPSNDASEKEWSNYKNQVESINKQLEKLTGSSEFNYSLDVAQGKGTITKEETSFLSNALKTIVKLHPAAWLDDAYNFGKKIFKP